MTDLTRWVTDHDESHSTWYIERFRRMAAEGVDLAGEARMVDAMLPRHARVLDAGCGPGRVGAELNRRGHTVVGVDADPALIEAAEADHPGPRWLVADLAELDLAAQGEPEPFDGGRPRRQRDDVRGAGVRAARARPGRRTPAHGRLRRDRVRRRPRLRTVDDLDVHAAAAGLLKEHRFATWDLRPWHDDADFAVSVFRRPA